VAADEAASAGDDNAIMALQKCSPLGGVGAMHCMNPRAAR
jgi:hypothetical protein